MRCDGRLMHHRPNALLWLGWNYDIREILEDLYLAVLACRLSQKADLGKGAGGGGAHHGATGGD